MQDKSYLFLTMLIFAPHFVGYLTLFVQTFDEKLIVIYVLEVLLFMLINILYKIFYPKKSRLLHCNMLMLMSIGFIVLSRINYDLAVKQVLIVGLSFGVCLIVPVIIKRIDLIKRFGWLYGFAALLLLIAVSFAGTSRYGATNWLEIKGFIFQPSELVKILFIFFVAAMFRDKPKFKRVCSVTAIAASIVLILVLQRDLGGALIFFITYLFMLYIATSKSFYLFSGLAAGSLAATVSYKLFNHVRVRVTAWRDPLGHIDKEGFQISQSLFAIGTGSWLGMGLNRGLTTSIPVVESDFIFSAISEEFGGLFAICLIMLYINCFFTMINISVKMEDIFYRLFCSGAAVMFGFQVFLCIGGVIKFIPSTGVTLPLISYGGSSMFVTILMFMIFQGIYMRGRSDKRQHKVEKPH